MLDDLFYADNLKAAQDAAMRPPPVPKQAAGFSAWRTGVAAPRGVVAGGAQVGAFGADVMGAFGTMTVASGMGDPLLADRGAQVKEAERIQREGLDFSSGAGDNLRGFARYLAPDPETAHTAERLVFDLTRVMTKAVGYTVATGNVVSGATLTGADEGMTVADDLKQAGVDKATRTKVGAVVGGFTGLGVALPVAGQTALQTAGLVLAGGPLSYMAQQQTVRSILQAQDYSKLAEQYDPFDPVGLAVSSLIPAGFGAWGLRAAKARAVEAGRAAEAQAARDFTAGPVPSQETPIARAAREATQEHVDAARVLLDAEQRRSTNPFKPDDLRAYDAHEVALSRAIDQLARGERVTVDDVLPPRMVSPETAAALSEIDALQAERAALLKAPDGKVRYFHGGNPESVTGSLWFTSHFPDAVGWASRDSTMGLWAVDVPQDHPARGGDQTFGVLPPGRAELPPELASQRQLFAARSRIAEIDKRVAALEQQVGPDARLSGFAQSIMNAGRAIEAELPKPIATKEPPKNAAEPAAPKPAAAEPASAAPAAPAAPARAEPAATGQDGARPAAANTAAGLVEDAAAAARVEQIKAEAPDLMVQLDGMDAPMRVDELLAAVKAEADDLVLDGELMQTAAECALRVGA